MRQRRPAINVGDTFGKLTVVREDTSPWLLKGFPRRRWIVVCSCSGREFSVMQQSINGPSAQRACRPCSQFIPDRIAKLSGKTFDYYDDGGTLTLSDFRTLAPLDCSYCELPPSCFNNDIVKGRHPDSPIHLIDRSLLTFWYSGMDRIDASIPTHDWYNVCPCCWMCNMAKSNKTLAAFNAYVQRIISHRITLTPARYRALARDIDLTPVRTNNALMYSVKGKSGKYKEWNAGDEIFYALGMMACYYCGVPPQNNTNRGKGKVGHSADFIARGNWNYSGLDRIDSSLGHILSNVVPCCHTCNAAKNNYLLTEFLAWIDRLRAKWTGRHITRDAIYVCPRPLVIAPQPIVCR